MTRQVVQLLDRGLSIPGDEDSSAARVDTFLVVLAAILAVEFWCHALAGKTPLASGAGFATGLASIAAPLALWSAGRRGAFVLLGLAELTAVGDSFPWTGNHRYFELFLCFFAASIDGSKAEERALLLRCVRWLVVIVLFYSGVQKLVHGFYFGGHYLAYLVRDETWRPVLGLLLPADEVERLANMPRGIGAGPYVPRSLPFLAVSNAVYLAEIGLALLLLWPPARPFAVVGALLLVATIELAARELFFGLTFTNAVLTFRTSPPGRGAIATFAALCVGALLVRLGWVPEVAFH